jgi:hypothetical protein
VPGETLQPAVVLDPGLRDPQAERLRDAAALDPVDDDRGQDPAAAGDDDLDLEQLLTAPDQVAAGVARDVGVAVQDEAVVGGPAEVRVVELEQASAVACGERGGAALRGLDDTLSHRWSIGVRGLHAPGGCGKVASMTTAEAGVAGALVDAIVARDITRVVALLDAEIDFRAMTPNRIWEATDPGGVEAILRQWFEDPDEQIHGVEATEPVSIRDTVRVGWLVQVSDAGGPHVFEQQAYVRERDGRVTWMRAICSGWIPQDPAG